MGYCALINMTFVGNLYKYEHDVTVLFAKPKLHQDNLDIIGTLERNTQNINGYFTDLLSVFLTYPNF